MSLRRLTLALDSLPCLREATASTDVDVAAAATLAELAGADAIRLGIGEELRPVREVDVRQARRSARELELRMPPSQTLLKVALDARPDRVLLAAEARDGRQPSSPLDLRGRGVPLGGVVRALGEAGIVAWAVVAPDLESVKVAHGEGVRGVELFTGALVDLPAAERQAQIDKLADAVRLAAKLRLAIGLGGGLGFRVLRELLEAAPAVESVAIGRAALAR
ncbi:MAG: pyridoxine 5'-phosphate synthase, partial [Candidatus Limnocylindria bacterium]